MNLQILVWLTTVPLAVLLIFALLSVLRPLDVQEGSLRPFYVSWIGWMLIVTALLPLAYHLVMAPASFFSLLRSANAVYVILGYAPPVLGALLGLTLLRMRRESFILAASLFFVYGATSGWVLFRLRPPMDSFLLLCVMPLLYGLIWLYTWRLKNQGLLHS